MKSYIQGLITGAVFVFAIFVFISAKSEKVGRYAALGETHVVDTTTGDVLFFARKNAIIAENPSNWVLTRISEKE
jgi:hypothetical protein